MSDLIDRQAAIEALDEQIWQCDKALSSFDISMKDEYAVKVERASLVAYKEQLEALPSVQPEPKWIPLYSGKLPEESGTYTVTAYDGATKRVTYAKYQKRLKRWELVGARAYWRVLAWMPLPEPYAERRTE